MVERTNSWHNAHKKLVWCTKREGWVIGFWVAFSEVVIVVRRLIREFGPATVGKADLPADNDLSVTYPRSLLCGIDERARQDSNLRPAD